MPAAGWLGELLLNPTSRFQGCQNDMQTVQTENTTTNHLKAVADFESERRQDWMRAETCGRRK